MLIDTRLIIWVLTEGKNLDKSLIKILDLYGFELSTSEKKTLKNALLGKHKPSLRTREKAKDKFFSFLGDISNDFRYKFEQNLIKVDYFSENFIKNEQSTREGCLNSFKREYDNFFLSGKRLQNTLLYREVEHIFTIIESSIPLIKEGNEKSLENYCMKYEIFSKVISKSDVLLNIEAAKSRPFSLNLLIYFLACIEIDFWHVENKLLRINNKPIMQLIIELILEDSSEKKLKPAFAYYMEFWKICGKELYNSDVSFNKIAEILDMDERELDHYKSVKSPRSVTKKHLKSIMEHESRFYPMIVFLRNFINYLIVLPENKSHVEKIENSLHKYPEFLKIAELRFEKYKTRD